MIRYYLDITMIEDDLVLAVVVDMSFSDVIARRETLDDDLTTAIMSTPHGDACIIRKWTQDISVYTPQIYAIVENLVNWQAIQRTLDEISREIGNCNCN